VSGFGERVDVRLTAQGVEIFHAGTLIAAHARAIGRGRRSTRRAHRPARHVAMIENNLARTLERAAVIGVATTAVLQAQALTRKHPEESLRSAQGILRLALDFSPALMELACERALALKSYSYRAVRTLIERPATAAAQPALDLPHENVRGAKYFRKRPAPTP
jgi:hypothetical protein